MRKLVIILFSVINLIAFSQNCPYLGPNQILPCGVNTTTLTADLTQCGPGGSNPNQTTNYGVTNIPYSPDSYTSGTQINTFYSQLGGVNNDDGISNAILIPFNFCFFGQTVTSFYVSSNNWVGFSAGQASTWITTTIPNVGTGTPKNCIMGPWQDINPSIGGTVTWAVYGTAPCRRLVISYYNVPMFSCTNQLYSSQIKIYESTNVIETHIQNKPLCATWNSGNAVHGLHNSTGTLAVVVGTRNNNQWSTSNEGTRFTPSGPTVTPILTWYQVGNPNPIGTGTTITVSPTSPTQYTCHFVYPSCNAGWASCNLNGSNIGPDTVLVVPGPPNLPSPTITSFNPTCAGNCDGIINLVPNGGNGITTISWNGQPNNFTINNLCSGVYNYTITDAAGCNISGSVTLTNPPIPVIGPMAFNDTVCYNSTSEIYSVPQQPGYTYQWSSVGNIISGQGSNTINVDWSSISSGYIPGAVMVTGYDANNCFSTPISIDLDIFNVLPVITPVGPFCSYDEFTTLQATPVGGVFSGLGVVDPNFYPSNAIGSNTITYTYTQSNCIFDTTTSIIVYPQPTIDSITPYNPFYEICEGDSVVTLFSVTSNLPGYNEWTFSNIIYQQDNISIPFSTVGMFPLSVIHYSNGCASPEQQTVITVARCPELLFYVPNSFTPNGDEFNNTWTPIFTSGYDEYNYKLSIFNRWGEVIFESNSPNVGWDGTYDNTMCPQGIYIWKVTYDIKYNAGRKEITGNVNLIR